MNHKSGAKRMPDTFARKPYETAQDVLDTFIDEKIFTMTKGDFYYSNLGYILLGAIIEKVTLMSYIDAYQFYIFHPLKMKSTSVGKTNIILYNQNKKKLNKKEYNERFFASTGGALYSCIKDLICLAKNFDIDKFRFYQHN